MHMILIADGGSTKTDWRLISPQNDIVFSIQTVGFNPYLSSTDDIREILWKELDPYLGSHKISRVFYYGAGCSTSSKNEIVSKAMETFFPEAEILIYHDLLGAARALFGDKSGIACILGTGSNSCLYDGKDIINNVPSLGYLFGDEGSGAYLGKMLLTTYLHDELPSDISDSFKKKYSLSLENILDASYNKGQPSRFLAVFSEFIFENNEHPFIKSLITTNFNEFFKYFVLRYPDYTKYAVSCVGSIAYIYQALLREVAGSLNIQIDQITKTPVEGLVAFHSNKNIPSDTKI
jgi:glucosamine kinase